MSEYYGVSTPNESFIAHYGIKGMKWGVRKFTDDITGKSNQKFAKLYGKNSIKNVSARKMRKHYNALDQSRANINQHMRGDAEDFVFESAKYHARRNTNDQHFDEKTEKEKHLKRLVQSLNNFQLRKQQMDNLKRMQEDIVKKANKLGYDGYYTSIKRSGIQGIPTTMWGSKVQYKKAVGHKPRNTTIIKM